MMQHIRQSISKLMRKGSQDNLNASLLLLKFVVSLRACMLGVIIQVLKFLPLWRNFGSVIFFREVTLFDRSVVEPYMCGQKIYLERKNTQKKQMFPFCKGGHKFFMPHNNLFWMLCLCLQIYASLLKSVCWNSSSFLFRSTSANTSPIMVCSHSFIHYDSMTMVFVIYCAQTSPPICTNFQQVV